MSTRVLSPLPTGQAPKYLHWAREFTHRLTCGSQKTMTAAETVAKNLRMLMDREKLTEGALHRRSGVSQKGINKILNCQSAPTIKTIDKLAEAFKMESWQFLIPLEEETLDQEWRMLLRAYTNASPEGRQLILHIADREVGR